MDFLEDLFDFDGRKRRKRGGFFQNESHHDHHDDEHDEHDDEHDHHHQYPTNVSPQLATNPAVFPPGAVCSKCSAQTVQGAKFCHRCGAPIEMVLICASCGSKLPANALFCPQCGFKGG